MHRLSLSTDIREPLFNRTLLHALPLAPYYFISFKKEKEMPPTLILIRHAQALHNATNKSANSYGFAWKQILTCRLTELESP